MSADLKLLLTVLLCACIFASIGCNTNTGTEDTSAPADNPPSSEHEAEPSAPVSDAHVAQQHPDVSEADDDVVVEKKIAPPPVEISFVFGGDIQFGRQRGDEVVYHGPDNPFRSLKSLFESADLSIVNLENPLCTHIPKPSKRKHPRMRGLPKHAKHLARAGIDVAILANNHAADCGYPGAKETLEALEDAGVQSAGMRFDGVEPRTPLHFKIHERDVYLFAVTSHLSHKMSNSEGVARVKAKHLHKGLAPHVRELREREPEALIVASLHWGQERQFQPREIQRKQARVLIDAGVDLIMGHHPHVVQPVEIHRGALVLYSLGNLYFDRDKRMLRETFVPRVTMRQQDDNTWTTSSFTLHPIYRPTMKRGPRLARAQHADRILDHLQALQKELGHPNLLTRDGDTLRWTLQK